MRPHWTAPIPRRARPARVALPLAARVGFLPTVALVVCILAWTTTAGAAVRRLETPRLSDIAKAGKITDSSLSPSAYSRLSQAAFWGGAFTANTGEVVQIFVSDTYPQDPAVGQRWADFLASLIHGSELSALSAYLMPLNEVQSYCGRNALACYSPSNSTLIAPGDDPASDTTAEAIVAHEYGHNVAAHRNNAPWQAIDYGTKRWASYEQVCSRAESGELIPGAETFPDYQYNPGEAFAETYRVLNERNLGLPETPWDIVTSKLYPDDTALALVRQDVLQPWASSTTSSFKGKGGRTYSVSTPLDGTFRVTVGGSKKARYKLIVNSGANSLASFTTIAGRAKTAQFSVCGQRSVTVNVRRLTKAGTFTLKIAEP